jgi:hypothetical protein
LEISASNDEKALGRCLDILEVVLERLIHIDFTTEDFVPAQIELQYFLAISLTNVEARNG